jgi:hypothetical protein
MAGNPPARILHGPFVAFQPLADQGLRKLGTNRQKASLSSGVIMGIVENNGHCGKFFGVILK